MVARTRSAGEKLLWLTVLTAVGMLASATAATVYAAGDTQRRHGKRVDFMRRLLLEPSRNVATIRTLADSLVSPLGVLPPIDSATLSRIVALISAPSDSAIWLAHAPADTTRAHALAVFRRWTRSEPLPAFWGVRPGFPGLAESASIPMSRLQPLKRLWKANEAEADSALLVGDTETALQRARENIAGARHLIEQPSPVDAMVGRVMLTDGVKLLARTALQADQPVLHSAAQRLLSLTRSLQPVPRNLWNMNRGEALEGRLLDLARDRTLHPATRFVAIELMVAGACASTREVLFGPSVARHQALNTMIDATRDIPRLVELRSSFHRTLDKLDHAPETFMGGTSQPRPTHESMSATLLRLVVPTRVQARIDACYWTGA